MTDTETEALYDPSDYTADEVAEYLATADSQEFARVKAAEAAGKDRVKVRNAVQDADQVEPDEDGYTRVVVATDW